MALREAWLASLGRKDSVDPSNLPTAGTGLRQPPEPLEELPPLTSLHPLGTAAPAVSGHPCRQSLLPEKKHKNGTLKRKPTMMQYNAASRPSKARIVTILAPLLEGLKHIIERAGRHDARGCD